MAEVETVPAVEIVSWALDPNDAIPVAASVVTPETAPANVADWSGAAPPAIGGSGGVGGGGLGGGLGLIRWLLGVLFLQ